MGEVALFSKGQGYSKADLRPSGSPAFLYGQMYTDYRLSITDSNQYLPQGSKGIFSTSGDVIVPASGESAQEIAIASVVEKAGILLGGDLNIIKPNETTLDSTFLALNASGGKLHNNLAARAQGKTIVHLHNPDIASSPIKFPTIPEQRLIGEFFSTLDSLIAAAERQEALLRQKKQAYLQLMFPREGKTQPRLRFSGFTGEWQQRQLGEVVSAAGVKNKERQHLQSYSISNQSGFIPQAEQFDNGGKPLDADKSSYWIVAPHSFAYNPARINVGSIGYWSGEEPVIVSSLYEVFQTHESVDDSFLLDWFRTRLFTNQIAKRQEGGVRQYFFFDKLQESQIHLPSLPEQHRIGQFFSTLDSLVSVAEGRTKALQVLKSAYLQRMFV